jgi:hypothetical protein
MTNEELFESAKDINAWWDENCFPTIGQAQYLAVIAQIEWWVNNHPEQTLDEALRSFLETDEVDDLWTMERVPAQVVRAICADLLVGSNS